MSRPVLFLDFDDVLCLSTAGGFGGYDVLIALVQVQNGMARVDDFASLWASLFDKVASDYLRRIDSVFHPVYVLSTSWAKFLDKETLTTTLTQSGLEFVARNLHPSWETPKLSSTQRAQEIQAWLESNPEHQNNWVVLDDTLSGTGFPKEATDCWDMKHVILCCPDKGLTRTEFDLVVDAFTARQQV